MSYKTNNKTKQKVHRKKKQERQKQLQEKTRRKKRIMKVFKVSWFLIRPLIRDAINMFRDIFL